METYEYCGVEYQSEAAVKRAAVYGWCEQYGDTLGEQAQYVNDHLDNCARDMQREWRIPYVDADSEEQETYRQFLLDFVGEQGIRL